MKNLSSKLSVILTVTLLMPSCGKLESEKKSIKSAMVTNQWLVGDSFTNECEKYAGRVEASGTICVYISDTAQLANGGSASSDTFSSYDTGKTIADGTAVLATGYSSGNAVEIGLNGSRISSVPSSGNRPVTTRGGRLQFLLSPGSFSAVQVYVYSCLNQAMQPTRCPY